MGALAEVCAHAHKNASGDEGGWWQVREAAQGLIADEDMSRFKKLCRHRDAQRYVEENEEEDIYDEWERYVRRGTTKYCGVSVGHEVQEEYENECDDSDDEDRLWWDDEDHGGRKYYLAYHQWSAFVAWLELRAPEEQGMVREFWVSPQFCRAYCLDHIVSNLSISECLPSHGRGQVCAGAA